MLYPLESGHGGCIHCGILKLIQQAGQVLLGVILERILGDGIISLVLGVFENQVQKVLFAIHHGLEYSTTGPNVNRKLFSYSGYCENLSVP